MSKDFKFDIINNDIVIPMQIVDKTDELKQRVYIALNTFLGEWFYNSLLGVDYYNTILQRQPNILSLEQEIRKTLEGFDEIISILEVKINKINYQTYQCKIVINTIYSENTEFNLILGGGV